MIDLHIGQSYLANYSTYWRAVQSGDKAALQDIKDALLRAWPGNTRYGMAPRDLMAYESALAILDSNLKGSAVLYQPGGASEPIQVKGPVDDGEGGFQAFAKSPGGKVAGLGAMLLGLVLLGLVLWWFADE